MLTWQGKARQRVSSLGHESHLWESEHGQRHVQTELISQWGAKLLVIGPVISLCVLLYAFCVSSFLFSVLYSVRNFRLLLDEECNDCQVLTLHQAVHRCLLVQFLRD